MPHALPIAWEPLENWGLCCAASGTTARYERKVVQFFAACAGEREKYNGKPFVKEFNKGLMKS